MTIENTVNASGGAPLDPKYIEQVVAVAHERRVPVHLDGARLWNAAAALEVQMADLCRSVDSVMVSLSKALACPVGSVVSGGREFVARARRARQLVGGGLHQPGIVAAAGLVAIQPGPDGMVDRIVDDHLVARHLAMGLAEFEFLDVEIPPIQTNFAMFKLRLSPDVDPQDARAQFVAALGERGVLVQGVIGGRVRAVTHYGVDQADIDRALSVVSDAWGATRLRPSEAA